MNLSTRLTRNSFWLFLARIGAQGAMVLVTYLLARRLGTTGFGEYAFIATILMISNTLTTFGTDMYLIREIAAKSDFSELWSVLFLQLILSALFIGLIYLFAPYFPNQTSESITALKVYSFALLPLAFFTVCTSVLRGTQRMTAYAWLNFLPPIVQVLAIVVFIHNTTDLILLAYLLLAIQVLGAIFAGILCASALSNSKALHTSPGKLISLFFACLPIALIAIVGIVYQKLSLTMVSFFGTASMVGLFSAAARVAEAARMGHFAVFTALYPAMANASEAQASYRTFRSSWILLLGISIIGSALLYFLADPIVNIFFGAEYRLSIPVLKILAFTLIPYTVNSFLSIAFLARKREKTVLHVLLTSLVLLLALNIWFIPRAGAIGAGWGILLAESVQAILFLLAWMRDPLPNTNIPRPEGVSYELSDLS